MRFRDVEVAEVVQRIHGHFSNRQGNTFIQRIKGSVVDDSVQCSDCLRDQVIQGEVGYKKELVFWNIAWGEAYLEE